MKIGVGMEIIFKLISILKGFNLEEKREIKVFHKLNFKEQNAIRNQYRKECYKEYKYSINLYILYVILGILSLGGLLFCYINLLWGMVIFTLNFIFMIVVLYFLIRSNYSFYKFLNSIGYVYDEK